jgi:hypothetical protein
MNRGSQSGELATVQHNSSSATVRRTQAPRHAPTLVLFWCCNRRNNNKLVSQAEDGHHQAITGWKAWPTREVATMRGGPVEGIQRDQADHPRKEHHVLHCIPSALGARRLIAVRSATTCIVFARAALLLRTCDGSIESSRQEFREVSRAPGTGARRHAQ